MIKIDNKIIGKGNPTYIIAEIGSNHNNDFEVATRLIEVAAHAGADAVKFQAFKAASHYSKYTPTFSYLNKLGTVPSTYDLIRSVEINREWHAALIEKSKSCNITFLSSPCDKDAIDQLNDLGMQAFKLASFDLPDIKLIEYMASFNKPMILSTGMADYSDMQRALNACLSVGNDKIIFLQCTSLYPAPVNIANLSAMETIHRMFGCSVGYSDHTLDIHIPIAAVALGATVIEKHFTLDRNQKGPDHQFAIEPSELSDMIKKIRDVELAIGNGQKNGPWPEEQEMFEKGRRSIHVKKDLEIGHVINKEDLFVKRPGYGINPSQIDDIVGTVLQKNVPEDHWLTWNDLKR